MSKIGLILSGGLAKGAYQIGALQAVGEYIKPADFTYFSAASVGVLNTYAFVSGASETARDMWTSVSPDGKAVRVTELLRSSLLQQSIVLLAERGGPVTKDFYFPLFSPVKRKLLYFNFRGMPPKDIPACLSASVAVPYYNKACTVHGEKYFDGAIVDNVPVYPLLSHDFDYLICVCLGDELWENIPAGGKIIRLTFPGRPSIADSMLVGKDSVERMIGEGYIQTKNTLDFVFSRGIHDVEYILRRTGDLNTAYPQKRRVRLTADAAIGSLNKITRCFTEKSISE